MTQAVSEFMEHLAETQSERPLNWRQRLTVVLVLAAALWVVHLVNTVFLGGRLIGELGIRPRAWSGLSGIFFAPFLHVGWGHLLSNTIPFLVLGGLVALRGMGQFTLTTLIIIVGGGFGTWMTGGAFTVHVGASGVVFGYFGFLLVAGLLERRPGSLLASLGVGLVYGGMIWGVFPTSPHVSWQGHLWGLAAGLVAARMIVRPAGVDHPV